MRLALAQISPRLADLPFNLELIERTALAAADQGAELALFPELALTGYRLRDLVPEVALRLDRNGAFLDRLAALSRRIPFVLGLVEETDEHRFHNSAVYFEDGALRFTHRKCYLPTYGMFDEAMDFAAGSRLQAFDSRFGRLGILICEDAWHCAAATVLTHDGATALLIPSVSPLRGLAARPGEDNTTVWRSLVETTARLHTTPVALVGRSGFEDGLAYAGASYAVGPGGEPLTAPLGVEPQLQLVTLDPDRTRSARAGYPLLRDERPDLIVRELQRAMARRHDLPFDAEPAP
ncbi:MAG: nitrilase-related carbon-nitrogen hydrolase [Acidobacteriota bacterium]